jgi:hypothetical protein
MYAILVKVGVHRYGLQLRPRFVQRHCSSIPFFAFFPPIVPVF